MDMLSTTRTSAGVAALAPASRGRAIATLTRAFAEDRNTKPVRHWRLVNEVPTVLMIIIVVLVIVKPF
jgi:uncharacterized membrane protein